MHCRWVESSGRTKIDDIEHLRCPVFGDACEQLAIDTCRHRDNRCEMRPVKFHKLDALLLLLPKLDVTVHGGRNQELRSNQGRRGGSRWSRALTEGQGVNAPCQNIEVENISVHETLVIAIRAR